MTDLQTQQHRTAWRVVVDVMPGSEFVSHEVTLDGEAMCAVKMPKAVMAEASNGCKTCGDPPEVVGLTKKCRDWHEVCNCGARFDEPKNKGCRRRKHPKEEK